MNVFIFGNNRVCLEIIKLLNSQEETNIVGVCLHEKKRQQYTNEIISELNSDVEIIEFDALREDEFIPLIKALDCKIAFSIYFGYILNRQVIDLFPKGIINIHPAYLPYNRGSASNVFSLIDNTPAGATIHYIDEGIDTGDIIVQGIVEPESIDTGKSLFIKQEEKCIELFQNILPTISKNQGFTFITPTGKGTFHRHSELMKLDEIHLDKLYLARDLLNLLRARTFRPHESAYFFDDAGRKVFVRLELDYE